MKNAGTRYVERIYKIAKERAEDYKQVRTSPFEVDKKEINLKREKYLKWSWCLWGAVQALSCTNEITQKEYDEYEERMYKLDEKAYEEE